MNDEFLQWLRAQLDDDAELAASGETWTAQEETQGTRRVDVDHSIERVVACTRDWRGLHIARHDPARVLAEVEAKRGVLRQYLDLREQVRNPVSAENRMRARALQGEIGDVLRLLALPYADRPGYRDEWRP